MSTIYSSFIQQSCKFICYLNKYNKFWENEQNLLLSLKICGFRNPLLKILWVPRNPRNPHQRSHCIRTFNIHVDCISKAVKLWKRPMKIRFWTLSKKRYNAICYQCRLKSFGLFNVHENNATYYQYCAFGWFYVHKKQRHLLKMLQKHRHDFENRSKTAFGIQWVTDHYAYH